MVRRDAWPHSRIVLAAHASPIAPPATALVPFSVPGGDASPGVVELHVAVHEGAVGPAVVARVGIGLVVDVARAAGLGPPDALAAVDQAAGVREHHRLCRPAEVRLTLGLGRPSAEACLLPVGVPEVLADAVAELEVCRCAAIVDHDIDGMVLDRTVSTTAPATRAGEEPEVLDVRLQ